MTMVEGDIKPIFIILVDISGYTRFIRYHKISLLHAEKIIAELMESILREVDTPVVAHEILGDAITFYSIDQGLPDQADKIYHQLHKYFIAFREREAELISSCSLCECDACHQVGKLRLKAILHHGQAAFTRVADIQKISGEDIIISHRLLKNSVPSQEYILMTFAFADKCLFETTLKRHKEHYEDVGTIHLHLNNLDHEDLPPANLPWLEKISGFLALEAYMVKRFFTKGNKKYKSLP
jgi:hypothetical protein